MIEKSYQGKTAAGMAIGNPVRDRDRGIQDVIVDLENELGETFNSSQNLADKLSGDLRLKNPDDCSQVPQQPAHVLGRLEILLERVRDANRQLDRSHRAVNG